MDELEKQLAKLSLHLRVAFAVACAQRVLIIYEYTSLGGIICRGPSVAIETAWSFSVGEEVDDKRIQYAADEIMRAYPEPDLGGGPDQFSCSTAAYALEAIKDETPKSAWSAAKYALYTIDQVDEGEGVEEETVWQERALQIAKEWIDKPIQRNMFDSLGVEKPAWVRRFE